jgi:hypothetical protein
LTVTTIRRDIPNPGQGGTNHRFRDNPPKDRHHGQGWPTPMMVIMIRCIDHPLHLTVSAMNSKTPGEEFWLIWFPCVLAAVVIMALYILAKLLTQ